MMVPPGCFLYWLGTEKANGITGAGDPNFEPDPFQVVTGPELEQDTSSTSTDALMSMSWENLDNSDRGW